jgi:hypothetical protein
VGTPTPMTYMDFSSESSHSTAPPSRPIGSLGDRADSLFMWPFPEAFQTKKAVYVEPLPKSLVQNYEVRGWGDAPRAAVVIPIAGDGDELPLAVLILGVNTRRPYDEGEFCVLSGLHLYLCSCDEIRL